MRVLPYVFTLVCAVPAFAFMPPTVSHPRGITMSAEMGQDRRDVVKSTFGFASVLGVLASLSPSFPAQAGYLNSDKLPEVIKPSDAEVDQDILKSSEVQNELKAIRNYKEGVSSLRSELAGNAQVDLYSRVRKDLDVSSLRDSLNKVNTVFSEDTQRGTDRIVRIILQDVNELEAATRQRPGTQRSDTKLKLITKKLKKLDAAFAELLTYF
ncbi:hypothetical protein Naga_100933g3 [Nannochloropsis gaditana]|uniref:Uncharacterized protein n=2 Tax=Nannochloropsis gaditana TaxID=72520 RepID=W7T5M2_9STRA|nr:hypothetical protein Naga_100933g3 [Nannochloropsis gaditana]